jgi:RNA polymerase sigma-70 factor (ECF subfamily)
MKPAVNRDPPLQLVRAGGGPGVLDAVYRRYCRYVAAVILRLGGRTEEVEDLIQDVFLAASRGIADVRQPEAVKGWLATIAVRVVRRRLRLRYLQRLLGMDVEADYSELVDPSASAADKVLLAEVYRVLDDVAVDDRLAFCLHHVEGETLEAVAELCGCSLATAKRRIARARMTIQQRLGDD